MSGLAAITFGLEGHGVISHGRRANMVIFDSDRVNDLATFDDPAQYPDGIKYVIVGGKVVVDGGEQREPGNGMAVRHGTGSR